MKKWYEKLYTSSNIEDPNDFINQLDEPNPIKIEHQTEMELDITHGSRTLRLRYAFWQFRDDSIRLRDALNLMDVLSLQFKIFRSLKII